MLIVLLKNLNSVIHSPSCCSRQDIPISTEHYDKILSRILYNYFTMIYVSPMIFWTTFTWIAWTKTVETLLKISSFVFCRTNLHAYKILMSK